LQILLVKDTVENQKVALLMLYKMGYWIAIATQRLEMLKALYWQPHKMVLIEVHMSAMVDLEAIYTKYSQRRAVFCSHNIMTATKTQNCKTHTLLSLPTNLSFKHLRFSTDSCLRLIFMKKLQLKKQESYGFTNPSFF
jgi:CheY-like chemotaxis protein